MPEPGGRTGLGEGGGRPTRALCRSRQALRGQTTLVRWKGPGGQRELVGRGGAHTLRRPRSATPRRPWHLSWLQDYVAATLQAYFRRCGVAATSLKRYPSYSQPELVAEQVLGPPKRCFQSPCSRSRVRSPGLQHAAGVLLAAWPPLLLSCLPPSHAPLPPPRSPLRSGPCDELRHCPTATTGSSTESGRQTAAQATTRMPATEAGRTGATPVGCIAQGYPPSCPVVKKHKTQCLCNFRDSQFILASRSSRPFGLALVGMHA